MLAPGIPSRDMKGERDMDSKRFDLVSRRLAAQSSRRGVIGAAVAILLGGGSAALLRDDASALTCRPESHLCTRGNQCCSGICEPPTADRLIRNRCRAATCVEGEMRCVDGNLHQFETCNQGQWIARNCAEGTECRSFSGTILCDWPIG